MRKAIPAICSTEPLTVLKRVVSVKSPKVSPSKINSGKCSSVVSRDNCASTWRRTVTDWFTFVSVACADASSSMIFHSPGRPSPETVLRKPGGGSLSLLPLKSKYRSPAAPGRANKTKTTQTMKHNIAPQRNKTEPADKRLRPACPAWRGSGASPNWWSLSRKVVFSMKRGMHRQVLECASLLALWQWRRANPKRPRTGAVQDAAARFAGSGSECIREKTKGAPHKPVARKTPPADPAEDFFLLGFVQKQVPDRRRNSNKTTLTLT